jgi:hypothetical protein
MTKEFSVKNLVNATTSYETAKAIQAGMKLWCVWSTSDPYTPIRTGSAAKKTGFVVQNPADMRRMAADLFRLADELDEYSKIWEDE